MVIQNSEVKMAAQSTFVATTKVEYENTIKPAIKLGNVVLEDDGEGFLSSLNYELNQSGEVQEAGEKSSVESVVANMQTRMQTMHYLLRAILMSKIFGDNSEFKNILQEIFKSNEGYYQTTTINYEYSESQELAYSAVGTAVTADGRHLNFNYGFAMSESFKEEFKSVEENFVRYIDPLVINLNDNPTKVSDQPFYFDLDGDGEKDNLHQLETGSGFLALDRNEDGEINDGKELFGATTGDGFKELEIFDEDCNGWIDENDSIFEKLRVWTMNEKGDMELYTLKQSDVGAIYLGRVRTDFVQHDDEHKAKAAMRETGIFLHESDGHAGGVSHVDFAT